MRKIGTIPTEEQAYRFGDFLYVQEIENTVEAGEADAFDVWVHDDAQLDAARAHLATFLADPAAATFDAAGNADQKRAEEARADARRKSRVINRERLGYERNYSAFAWLPMVLGLLSLIATILAGSLGFLPERIDPDSPMAEGEVIQRLELRQALQITEFRMPKIEGVGDFLKLIQDPQKVLKSGTDVTLPEVRNGQVWRLITPIFVHFGLLHIVFNMMWLRDLGGFIQNRFGPLYLGIIVLVSAILSNYGQLLWSGPSFGGMSGVNYALFGFLWMRGKHDRFLAWTLDRVTIQTMLIWFAICAVGLIPNVANMAHGIGLVAGMAWGFISGKRSTGAV